MECVRTSEEVLQIMEEGKDPDFKVHLKSCSKCKKAAKKFELVKDTLKTIKLTEPESAYFEKMATLIVDKAFEPKRSFTDFFSKFAVAAVVAFLVISVGLKFETKISKPDENMVINELRENPTLLNNVLIDNAEIDEIILAMAVQKTSNMTQKQLQQALDLEERLK